MRRSVSLLVIAIALASIGFGWQHWSIAEAQSDRSVNIDLQFSSGGADGEGCALRTQLLVTDEEGSIVGKLDLRNADDHIAAGIDGPGTVENGFCRIQGSIDLPEASFYTFAVGTGESWTYSASELDELGGQVDMVWLIP